MKASTVYRTKTKSEIHLWNKLLPQKAVLTNNQNLICKTCPKIKPNQHIKHKMNSGENCFYLKPGIIGQAGKATGRNSSLWKIETNDGAKLSIDLSKAQFTHIENENTTQNSSKLPPKNDELISSSTQRKKKL